MGPQFKVSSERLEKPGIKPTTPGLVGEQLNHYATEASKILVSVLHHNKNVPLLTSALFFFLGGGGGGGGGGGIP